MNVFKNGFVITDLTTRKGLQHKLNFEDTGNDIFSLYNKIALLTKQEIGTFRILSYSVDILTSSCKSFESFLNDFKNDLNTTLCLVKIKFQDRIDYVQKMNNFVLLKTLNDKDRTYFTSLFRNGVCSF